MAKKKETFTQAGEIKGGAEFGIMARPTSNGRLVVPRVGDLMEVWDLATYKMLRGIKPFRATWALPSENGERIIAATSESIFVLDAKCKVLREIPTGDLHCLAVSRDGRRGISLSDVLQIWDFDKGKEIARNSSLRTVCAAMSADGKYAAVICLKDKSIHLMETRSATVIGSFKGHTGELRQVVFAGDDTVASTSKDGTLRCWNIHSRTETLCVKISPKWLQCLAASADGRKILVSGMDGVVRLVDRAAGEVTHAMELQAYLADLAVAPDGRTWISCGEKVLVWHMP